MNTRKRLEYNEMTWGDTALLTVALLSVNALVMFVFYSEEIARALV